MPVGDWRKEHTLGLGAILTPLAAYVALTVLAGGDPLRCQHAGGKPGYVDSDPRGEGQAPSDDPGRPVINGAYKQLNCQNPKGRQDYEHCQQWRSAEAAEEQACLARRQFWLGILGVVGLLGTIIYAAKSARAAGDAAVQMAREVDVQMRVEQPLIFIRNMKPQRLALGKGAISCEIENIGRTPAVLHSMYLTCEVGVTPPAQPLYGEPRPIAEGILDKGERWPCTAFIGGENRLDAVLDGNLRAHLWGFVIYEDVFGRMRITGFGYEGKANRVAAALVGLEGDYLQWQRFGAAAYNYDHEGDA